MIEWFKYVTVIFFLSIVLSACNNDDGPNIPSTPNRIVIAYMGGDNNLSPEVTAKINALKAGWSSSFDGRLFVYADSRGAVPVLMEIIVSNGETTTDTLKIYEEANSADPEVYREAINYVIDNYKAESYGLIVFSHATGWLPGAGAKAAPKAIILDGSDSMEIADFAAATPSDVLDFIIFEACFMAGIEVVYELKDKADYILVSAAEIVSPGFTSIYSTDLDYLFSKTANLEGFAKEAFTFQAERNFGSATFSIIKTDQLEALAAWIKNNGSVIDEGDVEDISSIQQFGRTREAVYDGLFFDLVDSYSSILADDQKIAELQTLVTNCVVYKEATESFLPSYGGFLITDHSGLTTYIIRNSHPTAATALRYNTAWKELKWYKAIGN